MNERRASADNLKRIAKWKAWLSESDELAADILARRAGRQLDMDALWEKMIADREARDEQIIVFLR